MQDTQAVYRHFSATKRTRIGIPCDGQNKATAYAEAKKADGVVVCVYFAQLGEDNATAAANMVDEVERLGDEVCCEFNGIVMHARQGDSVAAVRHRWRSDMEAAAEAYAKSPEGIAAAAEHAAWASEQRALYDALTAAGYHA